MGDRIAEEEERRNLSELQQRKLQEKDSSGEAEEEGLFVSTSLGTVVASSPSKVLEKEEMQQQQQCHQVATAAAAAAGDKSLSNGTNCDCDETHPIQSPGQSQQQQQQKIITSISSSGRSEESESTTTAAAVQKKGWLSTTPAQTPNESQKQQHQLKSEVTTHHLIDGTGTGSENSDKPKKKKKKKSKEDNQAGALLKRPLRESTSSPVRHQQEQQRGHCSSLLLSSPQPQLQSKTSASLSLPICTYSSRSHSSSSSSSSSLSSSTTSSSSAAAGVSEEALNVDSKNNPLLSNGNMSSSASARPSFEQPLHPHTPTMSHSHRQHYSAVSSTPTSTQVLAKATAADTVAADVIIDGTGEGSRTEAPEAVAVAASLHLQQQHQSEDASESCKSLYSSIPTADVGSHDDDGRGNRYLQVHLQRDDENQVGGGRDEDDEELVVVHHHIDEDDVEGDADTEMVLQQLCSAIPVASSSPLSSSSATAGEQRHQQQQGETTNDHTARSQADSNSSSSPVMNSCCGSSFDDDGVEEEEAQLAVLIEQQQQQQQSEGDKFGHLDLQIGNDGGSRSSSPVELREIPGRSRLIAAATESSSSCSSFSSPPPLYTIGSVNTNERDDRAAEDVEGLVDLMLSEQQSGGSRETSWEKEMMAVTDGGLGFGIGLGLSLIRPSASSLMIDQISIDGGGGGGSMRSFDMGTASPRSGNDSSSCKGQPGSGGSGQHCHHHHGHQGSQRHSGGSGGSGSVSSKRKSAWYQMLNPTYRSRCEDFKRIFKDLPADERLIVDYSCALQRDILLQGRIYVTQNYLCFYANIFRWETLVQLRWKEVSSVTKEKTALVIPNAIQVCTESSEKHFFCSFGARDKTYVVLFRTWQQALLDQPLCNQELWKFVHSVYGTELGFSSNDEAAAQQQQQGQGSSAAGIDQEDGGGGGPAGHHHHCCNNSNSSAIDGGSGGCEGDHQLQQSAIIDDTIESLSAGGARSASSSFNTITSPLSATASAEPGQGPPPRPTHRSSRSTRQQQHPLKKSSSSSVQSSSSSSRRRQQQQLQPGSITGGGGIGVRQSISCDVPVGLQDAPLGGSSGVGAGEGQADGNKATAAATGSKMPVGGSSDRSSTASAPAGYNGLADALSDVGGEGLAPPNLPPPPPPPSYTDSSDSSDDDRPLIDGEGMESGEPLGPAPQCPLAHDGRQMLSMTVPIGVDDLFTLLFTNSSFFMDFLQTTRKSTDLQLGQWQEAEHNPAEKVRTVAFNLPLNVNLGVKTTRTTETQTLLEMSRAGDFYAVNVDVCNSGVPYSDTFYVACHYCILRCVAPTAGKQSRLVIHCQVKYRKSVWGIVKTFIEKNAWSGLEENFAQLKRNLQLATQPAPLATGARGGAGGGVSDDQETGGMLQPKMSLPALSVSGSSSSASALKHTRRHTTQQSHHPHARLRRHGRVASIGKDGELIALSNGGLLQKDTHPSAMGASGKVGVGGDAAQVALRSTSLASGGGRGRHSTAVKMSASSSQAFSSVASSSSSSPTNYSSSISILTVIFISLVLLLCTNGFLFSKIWALERLADQLAASASTSASSSCLGGGSNSLTDLRVLTMEPKSPEEWMRILRQQETIYRSTESKWLSALSSVNDHLKQTQDTLALLEKDVMSSSQEPDADLIRAILDKLQQLHHSTKVSSAEQEAAATAYPSSSIRNDRPIAQRLGDGEGESS